MGMRKASNQGFRRQRAFTLVEVLATLVLVAIILPVAMKGISLAAATAGDAKRKMEAAALVQTAHDICRETTPGRVMQRVLPGPVPFRQIHERSNDRSVRSAQHGILAADSDASVFSEERTRAGPAPAAVLFSLKT